MEVMARLQAGGNLTAYLDLFRYASVDRFALAFAAEVLNNDRALSRGPR